MSPMSWSNEETNTAQNLPDYDEEYPYFTPPSLERKRPTSRIDIEELEAHDLDAVTMKITEHMPENLSADEESDDKLGCFCPY